MQSMNLICDLYSPLLHADYQIMGKISPTHVAN
jgi:hypothetical protein